MRLLFAGSPAAAVPSLSALREAGHEIVAVVTNPDAPKGRGRRPAPSPVAVEAGRLGLPVFQPRRAKEPWFVDAITKLAPDLAVVVAWGCLVPDDLLTVPSHGWVNLHFSLLPAWRGAAPVQRAIMAGETLTGVTTFELVRELDAGPVYRRAEVAVADDETAGDLLGRLAAIGARVLVDTVADVAAGAKPSPQPAVGISLAAKVSPEDARIDWRQPAVAVHDAVRGTTPDPGAWTTCRGERLNVGRTALHGEAASPLRPGQLSVSKRGVLVGTGDGVIRLVAVQSAGKAMMDAAAWARGARVEGESLG